MFVPATSAWRRPSALFQSTGVEKPRVISGRSLRQRTVPSFASTARMKDAVSESQTCTIFPLARSGDAPMPNGLLNGPSGTRHRSSPFGPNEINPKSVKNATMLEPSVATLGDAGLFDV